MSDKLKNWMKESINDLNTIANKLCNRGDDDNGAMILGVLLELEEIMENIDE